MAPRTQRRRRDHRGRFRARNHVDFAIGFGKFIAKVVGGITMNKWLNAYLNEYEMFGGKKPPIAVPQRRSKEKPYKKKVYAHRHSGVPT